MPTIRWASLACLLFAAAACAAETVTVTAGHLCCGGCVAAFTAGAKQTDWVDTVKVTKTTAVITAKEGTTVELAALLDNLARAGLPANDVVMTTPVALTMGHLCCGGCAGALVDALKKADIRELDKAAITADLKTATVTLRPAAGQSLNLITALRVMQDAGFAPVKIVPK